MGVKVADIRKEYKEMPYKVRNGVVCITPCTLRDFGDRPFIGSVQCQKCAFFRSKDREKQVVICAYNEISAKRTKQKDKEIIEPLKEMVYCVTDGKEYPSLTQASKAYGIARSTIVRSIQENVAVKQGKFKFEYIK